MRRLGERKRAGDRFALDRMLLLADLKTIDSPMLRMKSRATLNDVIDVAYLTGRETTRSSAVTLSKLFRTVGVFGLLPPASDFWPTNGLKPPLPPPEN